MKWINIKDEKPASGQCVLVWHEDIARVDRWKKNPAAGVRMGKYQMAIGMLRPVGAMFGQCEWWMPLPDGPDGKSVK